MDEVPEVARVACGVGRRLVPVEPVEVRVMAVRVVVAPCGVQLRPKLMNLLSTSVSSHRAPVQHTRDQQPLDRQSKVALACQLPGTTCDPAQASQMWNQDRPDAQGVY